MLFLMTCVLNCRNLRTWYIADLNNNLISRKKGMKYTRHVFLFFYIMYVEKRVPSAVVSFNYFVKTAYYHYTFLHKSHPSKKNSTFFTRDFLENVSKLWRITTIESTLVPYSKQAPYIIVHWTFFGTISFSFPLIQNIFCHYGTIFYAF